MPDALGLFHIFQLLPQQLFFLCGQAVFIPVNDKNDQGDEQRYDQTRQQQGVGAAAPQYKLLLPC